MKTLLKNFIKKPVRIIFLLFSVTLILANILYYDEIINFISEYAFLFTFGVIIPITFIAIYNFIKYDINSPGIQISEIQKQELKELNK